jgi:hypothetical protein
MFGDELDLDNPRLSVDGSSFNFVVYFFGAVNKYDGFALIYTILKTNIGQDASEVESSSKTIIFIYSTKKIYHKIKR